ncbi:MAG: hypothetical protein HS117_00920 [Verrucomicrobiaceae bacterium]|nr:hypothetical protein [Verrucomicrobiaceae bacterium]
MKLFTFCLIYLVSITIFALDQAVIVAKNGDEKLSLKTACAKNTAVELEGSVFVAVPLSIEANMQIQNRADWITRRVEKIVLPKVSFEGDSLQDCLEYLRRSTSKALIRMDESDDHIHFLRKGPDVQDYDITLTLVNVSVLEVVQKLASMVGGVVRIVDYGVLIELQYKDAPLHGKKKGHLNENEPASQPHDRTRQPIALTMPSYANE